MRREGTIDNIGERFEVEQLIMNVLVNDPRVLFAYLYGSFLHEEHFHDIDIAVYVKPEVSFFSTSSDLKVELHKHVGFFPDFFDVRVMNDIPIGWVQGFSAIC